MENEEITKKPPEHNHYADGGRCKRCIMEAAHNVLKSNKKNKDVARLLKSAIAQAKGKKQK